MRHTFYFIIFCLFAISSAAPNSWAQTVTGVAFDGLASIPEEGVRSKVETTAGSSYSAAQVSRDIKALYQSGMFRDVKVEKVKDGSGLKLVFHVVPNVTIGKLTITGNKKIKKDDLSEALAIHEYDLLDPAKLTQTKAQILKLYEDKGYYLVEVDSKIEPFDEAQNQVELVLTITENRSVKIRRIKFLGNHVFSDGKLRKKMRTKERGLFGPISGSGKLEDEKLNRDLQMLRYFYQDNGYLHAEVGEPQITLSRTRKGIYIAIPVVEGQQYKVSGVGIAGDIITSEEEIIKKLKQEVGKTYRKSLEIEDLQTLEKLYGDQAYAFSQIVPQIETDESSLTARVTYFVQKGPKVKIDKIIIKGNTTTLDKVIRRELRVYENAYYSQTGIELSRTRLNQLGYFETVDISTPRGSSDDRINLVIEVKEKSTGTFSVGAGFSTLENFIFTATVQKENFFGRGWAGGVSANISKLRQDFVISMSDRYFLDTRWSMAFTLQKFKSALNSDFDQDRFGGSFQLGREIFDFFTLMVGYRIEDISVTDFSAEVPAFFQLNASGLTSAVFTTIAYDRRDNRVNTKKGSYTSLSVEHSTDKLGADNNYIRYSADQRVFFKLPANFVLKGRGTFGYINSMDNNPVPLFDRYFMGGINTLRGYELNSIGPTITVPATLSGGDNRFTYGGNKMVMFNAELEIPIYAPAGVMGVAFIDAGNAFAETQNVSLRSLRMDYGFGFRWQSPFGPLRFEWGFPINKRSDESSTVFNFTIGQSF